MPTTELTRRDGVELARSGVWELSTGTWRAAPEDFAAAIAATACPAVDRPYLRLGHCDPRFPLVAEPPKGDGEPALGWIENLRLTDGGNTLVGDWVDIPDWLNSVAASAYPRRSVEGAYNRRCALGHVHPFVLDGLALLGVTRPGVGTLKPIGGVRDVRALFAPTTVAASSGEVRIAASIPGAALAAAAEQHTGAMIALIPTEEDAQRLAVDGGEPADQLHVTLMYLGDAADLDARMRQDILDSATTAVNGMPVVEAEGFALSVFNPPGSTRDDGKQRDSCITLGLSGDLLDAVHAVVAESVRYASPKQHAPWHAHLTLLYTDDVSRLASLADRTGPVRFDRVRIAFGGVNVDIPLIGEDDYDPSTTADEPVKDDYVAAAAGDENRLKRYWLAGPGLKRWATKRHPWTTLYRILRRWLDPERARRTASSWYRLHFGHMPNQKKKVNASEVTMPNPQPSDVDRIKAAWNATAPFSQHIHMVRGSVAIVLDESDRSFWRVPVTVDGDTVRFGDRQRVMPDFVDYDEQAVAASVVFASRAESRPEVAATVLDSPSPIESDPPNPILPVEPPPTGPPAEPDPTEQQEPQTPPPPGGVSVSPHTPGAEPEQQVPTEPKEGPVPDMSALRSRLGLADDADEAAIVAAIDALKQKAEQPEPNPEQVAASAARDAENAELKAEVKVLASRMEQVTAELAATKAKEAAVVKASVLDEAQKQGKFSPAAREQWEKDYDEAPAAITRVLASIAPGTAVPVTASGFTGTGDENVDGFDKDYDKFFRTEKAEA